MQYIYSIYIYIYIYILDVLVARTANFQRCQLAFCLRVVYVCFYSQLICIYYIDFFTLLQPNSQFIEKIRHKNQHNLHSNDQDYYQHAADNHNHYHNDSVLGCTSIAFSSFFFLYVIYLYTRIH